MYVDLLQTNKVARGSLIDFRGERLAQRVNFHLAAGGSIDTYSGM